MFKVFTFLFFLSICLLNAQSDNIIGTFDFTKHNTTLALDSTNLPKVELISKNDKNHPAYFIIAPYDPSGTFTQSAMIFDKSFNNIKTFTSKKPFFDFKPTTNGLFSYFDILKIYLGYGEANVVTIDTTGKSSSTFTPNNEYSADFHDFKYLPNGNKIFIAYENNFVDMSKYDVNGNPNANYLDGIIQEVDGNGKTVFQWRSGHKIDVTETYNALNLAVNSYIHINSLDLDLDGNFIISCRNISQIIKINRKTGEIIWRMGGKKNEFTFLNEHEENSPNYFSFTHCVRVLPNGNLLIFDNGNLKKTPNYSRAIEYELDQTKKTAKLVWEYRHNPDIFTPNQGSVQRLKNGNTLIGWGGATTSGTKTAATEVTSNGEVVFEVGIPEGLSSYRVLKIDELTCPPVVSVAKNELAAGNTYDFNEQIKKTGLKLKVNALDGFIYNKLTFNRFECCTLIPNFEGNAPKIYNYRLQSIQATINSFDADARLNLQLYPEVFNKASAKIYFKSNIDKYFKELPTTYDVSNNELLFVIKGFGDYLIGEPIVITNKPSTPFLQLPENNSTLKNSIPVKFRWQTEGYATKHRIQISLDSTFASINFEVKDTNVSVINITIDKISNQSAFAGYWRVSSGNENGYSNWSNKNTFYFGKDPIIVITNVNTGDTINKTSRKIIRWNTNIDDSLSLTLLKNEIEVLKIKKSFYSFTNSIDWTVPDTIANSSDYSFKLSTLNPVNMRYDAFSNKFIVGSKTGVDDLSLKSKIEFYPNPVLHKLNLINLELSNSVRFNIRDLKGKIVKSFDNSVNNNSFISLDCFDLISGVYLLEIIDLDKKLDVEFVKN
ncbi:MAG: aryl-sulfate sulfotransferase [Candidatus Kapabacteria bacterium]|nr:aryl-sulfate sulfotransferase [Candidatus Kapabacteria bacterium]